MPSARCLNDENISFLIKILSVRNITVSATLVAFTNLIGCIFVLVQVKNFHISFENFSLTHELFRNVLRPSIERFSYNDQRIYFVPFYFLSFCRGLFYDFGYDLGQCSGGEYPTCTGEEYAFGYRRVNCPVNVS